MEDIFDKVKEECGVFGLVEPERSNVASSAYFALYALQHRGQESCGIAVNDDGVINAYKDLGLVPDVFKRDVLDSLGKGDMVMGHCRYAVTDAHSRQNCQPLLIRHVKGPLALCTNGALTNEPWLTADYAYRINVEDMTLSVGQEIPLKHEVIKMVGSDTVTCELLQLSGPKLSQSTSGYSAQKAGEAIVVFSATIEANGASYTIYSAPVCVTITD